MTAEDGPSDMLRCVLSPLSRRGRFLVTEESASSIEFLGGGLGPSDVARGGGVRGVTSGKGSMLSSHLNCLVILESVIGSGSKMSILHLEVT